jgi:tRNA G18 (ribose-2'-O)-methylase SpoU
MLEPVTTTFVTVDQPDHDLAADFVALNDPTTRRAVERHGGYFVVEGVLAIERLLELDDWSVRSLLLLPAVADRLRDRLAASSTDLVVGVADEDVLRSIVGFDLHRGALASVERRPSVPLEQVAHGHRFVVAEGVNDHENLGALYRNAAAFGIDAVLLDPTCADPFYRRSIRVSLGHVLAVPTVEIGPLPHGLSALHSLGVSTVALTPSTDVDIRAIAPTLMEVPAAIVVGAEGPGLRPETIAAASHRAAIRMAAGVDSLNVSVAAAIAMHQLGGGVG